MLIRVNYQPQPFPALLFLARLLMLFIYTYAATASAAPLSSLTPFKAHYKATFDMGLSVDGTATRELKRQPNGRWQFSQNAKAMIATVEEQSDFSVVKQNVIPLRYSYLRKIFGKERHALLTFDWNKNQVTNNVQNKPWKLTIKPRTVDKLSYQIQLSQDLKHGKKDLQYQIADGGKIKLYRFDIIGKEQLETPLGTLETIKVRRIRSDGKKRETLIWFAQSINYMLVKLSQTDDKGKKFNLMIEQIETPNP
ncbi:MAG: DUF3108 domain-containing protein [Motiliproteus sp.]